MNLNYFSLKYVKRPSYIKSVFTTFKLLIPIIREIFTIITYPILRSSHIYYYEKCGYIRSWIEFKHKNWNVNRALMRDDGKILSDISTRIENNFDCP